MAKKQKKTVNSQNIIPIDLCLAEIFPHLPVKSLIRFKSVAKQWNFLISSPDFSNLHLALRKHTHLIIQATDGVTYNPFTFYNLKFIGGNFELSPFIIKNNVKGYLIGSCNGLICYYKKPRFFISNPTLQKLCSIPLDSSCDLKAPNGYGSYFNDICIHLAGFGYDSSTNDYKIVFISRLNNFSGYLLTLKKNMWKKLDMSWYTNRNIITDYQWLAFCIPRDTPYPIQVKNTLHWLLNQRKYYMTHIVLLTFDLAEEVFSIIDLTSPDHNTIGITQIRGCLCKVLYQPGTGKKLGSRRPHLELQMQENYGVWDSWQTLYVCDLGTLSRDYLNFFEFRDDNNLERILILKNCRKSNANYLRVHFIDSERLHQPSEVSIEDYGGNNCYFWLGCAFSFTESLIWPSYFPA